MIEKINSFEISLIDNLRSHPLFLQLDSRSVGGSGAFAVPNGRLTPTAIASPAEKTLRERLDWSDLLKILIQRRFLSLSIVNVYEFVIDALTDPEIKKTVRGILNEEYPRNTKGVPLPSHRELLFQDLLNLGATANQIITTPETKITQQVRTATTELMVDYLHRLDPQYHQVGLIAFLRFWAEVTVSVEYSCLWPRISERLAKGASRHKIRSEFYYFHMIHDNRSSDLGKEGFLGGLTHAQELAVHLQKLVCDEAALDCCLELEMQAHRLKYQFYDQFLVDRI